MELTDSARSYIVDAGYDPVYGARPLKRFLQSKVETLIARKILSEDLHHGSVLTVDYDGPRPLRHDQVNPPKNAKRGAPNPLGAPRFSLSKNLLWQLSQSRFFACKQDRKKEKYRNSSCIFP